MFAGGTYQPEGDYNYSGTVYFEGAVNNGIQLVHINSTPSYYGFVNINVTYTYVSVMNINITYNQYYIYRSSQSNSDINATGCCFFRGGSGMNKNFIILFYFYRCLCILCFLFE
jgi:hypothetical protein